MKFPFKMDISRGTEAAADDFVELRRAMVAEQLAERGIRSTRVLNAMTAVPRHEFVPVEFLHEAYEDKPLPIGEGQTISQPYMVAVMTAALELEGSERVLEVGTGSGYQAAVLALLAAEVHTIENHAALAEEARERLARLGYANAHVHTGDGTLGLPSSAPFDAIIVSAGAPFVPSPLLEQLAEGGRLVIPVGSAEHQELLQLAKSGARTSTQHICDCRFVPLVGQHGWPRSHLE